MRGRLYLILLAASGSLALGSPPREASITDTACALVTAANADTCLRLNHLQVLGTHNSYHLAPEPPVLAALGTRAAALDYTHRTLTEQLSRLGVRQFEIDVYADPHGGLFASPAALRMGPGFAALERPGPALRAPGFKVLHVPDLDFRVTCATLVACLTEIRQWSRAHPSHVPIMVMLELKDTPVDDPRGLGFVTPVPFDGALIDALDAEIRSVFDASQVLTPDDVRGRETTLREAIEKRGWPRLGDVRGKVLFAMDNTGEHRDRYLAGHRSLEGRMLFVSAEPGTPAAAFLKMNEAVGAAGARIRPLAEAGYVIRTRADEPGKEAHTGETTRRDAAFRSGAHFVSTDYPETSPHGSGYIARLPGAAAAAARCNPVTAPAGCTDAWLEPR